MAELLDHTLALKLRKIPAAMLRIPDASHDIEAKGSNLVAQTIYTIDWFDSYRGRRQSP